MATLLGIPKTKIIDGKKYALYDVYKLKSGAESACVSLRRSGWSARKHQTNIQGKGTVSLYNGWAVYYAKGKGF